MLKTVPDSRAGRHLLVEAKVATSLPKGEFSQITPVAEMPCCIQIKAFLLFSKGLT